MAILLRLTQCCPRFLEIRNLTLRMNLLVRYAQIQSELSNLMCFVTSNDPELIVSVSIYILFRGIEAYFHTMISWFNQNMKGGSSH